MKAEYCRATTYVTKDGSIIRELIHPASGQDSRVSLAEATVPPGGVTFLHVHRESEEIYHVTQGRGIMTLDRVSFEMGEGDSVLIRPGVPHRIENMLEQDLKILCCCCPPYSHADTELQ